MTTIRDYNIACKRARLLRSELDRLENADETSLDIEARMVALVDEIAALNRIIRAYQEARRSSL